MTSETIRIEKVVITPTNAQERAAYLGAKVTHEGAEVSVRVYLPGEIPPDMHAPGVLRFKSAAEIAALEDVLRVMRTRLEEHERAALTK